MSLFQTLKEKAKAAPRVRMIGAPDLSQQFDRPREDGRDEDAPLRRQPFERIAYEDMTLTAGIITEEVHEAIAQGWAINEEVAAAANAYAVRTHAPHLMESDPLPYE